MVKVFDQCSEGKVLYEKGVTNYPVGLRMALCNVWMPVEKFRFHLKPPNLNLDPKYFSSIYFHSLK